MLCWLLLIKQLKKNVDLDQPLGYNPPFCWTLIWFHA